MQRKNYLLALLVSFMALPLFAHTGKEPAVAVDSLTTTTLTSAEVETLTPNQHRKQRGVISLATEIVPKGQWIFGGTGSYSTHSNDSYKLLVIEGINSNGYTVKVSPLIAYSPKKNMAFGVRFAYGRSLFSMDGASVSVAGAALNVDYFHAIKHSYEGVALWRQYIPLGNSKRFALFTETQISLGGMQAKFAEGANIRGTYQTGYNVSVGLNPGIVAFATNNIALEVNVGVLGLNYSHVNQVHNQVTTGDRSGGSINFRVNLLSIGVGVGFYL
jgi:hypothetical protein